jgi:hypothetical protein
LDTEKAHFSVINIVRIPRLLFPDNLAIACSQVTGYKKIALVNQYFKNWNMYSNSRKSHIMVFKKRRKLKAAEGWRINGQNLEVVDNFNYLGVTLENTGSWNKQKMLAKSKGYQVLVAVDTSISVIVDVKLQMLEYIHEIVCESMIMCGMVV